MKLEDFLEKSGMTKSAVADFCQVTRGALTKWEEIPDKHMVLLSSFLKEKIVTGETVTYLTKEDKRRQDRKAAGVDLDDYGSGSEWDREYSAMYVWPLSQKVIFLHRMKDLIGWYQVMGGDGETRVTAEAALEDDLKALLTEYSSLGEWV